jgi:hypothetical protein
VYSGSGGIVGVARTHSACRVIASAQSLVCRVMAVEIWYRYLNRPR